VKHLKRFVAGLIWINLCIAMCTVLLLLMSLFYKHWTVVVPILFVIGLAYKVGYDIERE
jgi:hypothetical protein